jgi:hypothetical protein
MLYRAWLVPPQGASPVECLSDFKEPSRAGLQTWNNGGNFLKLERRYWDWHGEDIPASRTRMGEWSYTSTILDLGSRWR